MWQKACTEPPGMGQQGCRIAVKGEKGSDWSVHSHTLGTPSAFSGGISYLPTPLVPLAMCICSAEMVKSTWTCFLICIRIYWLHCVFKLGPVMEW